MGQTRTTSARGVSHFPHVMNPPASLCSARNNAFVAQCYYQWSMACSAGQLLAGRYPAILVRVAKSGDVSAFKEAHSPMSGPNVTWSLSLGTLRFSHPFLGATQAPEASPARHFSVYRLRGAWNRALRLLCTAVKAKIILDRRRLGQRGGRQRKPSAGNRPASAWPRRRAEGSPELECGRAPTTCLHV